MLKKYPYHKTNPLFLCLPVLLALVSLAVPARAEPDVELGASLRAIGLFSNNPDFAPFYGVGNAGDFSAQSILRLTAEGAISKRVTFQAHAVQSVTNTSAPASLSGSSPLSASQPLGTYRAIDSTLDWSAGRRTRSSAWLDRFNVRIEFKNSDLTIGRQAVSFGKAWFWNPLDVFFPFDANQFDRDYKPGVDAARWDLALGAYSGFTLIAAAGRTQPAPYAPADAPRTLSADWDGSALVARWFSFINDWDVSIQAGKVYGGWHVGGGAVGESGPYQLRFEGAQFYARKSPAMPFPYAGDALEDAFSGVFGIGRYYRSSLDLEFEYLYNGAGEPDNLDAAFIRSQYGTTQHLGRHVAGVSASYELDPLTNVRLSVLHSIGDQSTQLQPTVSHSLSDNADLLAGLNANFGSRPQGASPLAPQIRSEFGLYPNALFVEWKKYY